MTFVISRTPYRVSFFGGGSDYPSWYREEGGAVLSTAIDKYCYISARYLPAFFNIKHRVVWTHIENVNAINEILHPAVRGCMRWLGFDDEKGVEIHHQGDLPARAGVGSGSSFAVGLIRSLLALRGQTEIDKHELALKAIDLEQVVLKDAVGSQDQMAAAHGGLNVIRFATDGTIAVEPLNLPRGRRRTLESRLMLVFTGTSRLASEVAQTVIEDIGRKKEVVREMRAMVEPAAEILRSGDLDDFGHLLHEGWRLKRGLSKVITTPFIDELYETARGAGALGGKLLGAGQSGFMLLYVRASDQEKVAQALNHFIQVPVRVDLEGCALIHQPRSDGDEA